MERDNRHVQGLKLEIPVKDLEHLLNLAWSAEFEGLWEGPDGSLDESFENFCHRILSVYNLIFKNGHIIYPDDLDR